MSSNGTLVERVASDLRAAILEGRLRAGERIGQDALAKQFGTSRLPVREALRLLQNEGLVSLKPNAGARVASLTMAELSNSPRSRATGA
jgi:DNA-binding GntR family transcriptional regulator